MSRYEGLIVYALFYRLSPLRVAFAYGWVFIETTIPTWIYVCVSFSYDLPQKPKPPWKSTTRFRVWHLSVRRYHQAYKSLFVYVSLAGFGHICPFLSTFCHFFTRTCEAHVLNIYICIYIVHILLISSTFVALSAGFSDAPTAVCQHKT